MTNQHPSNELRPGCVAFVQCNTAITFGQVVHMDKHEELCLTNFLATLQDAGLVLRPCLSPGLPGWTFAEVVAHLRWAVGGHLIDAFLAGTNRLEPGAEPAAVAPVWPFDREGVNDDIMVSSARLWGVDLLVEALRVRDENDPVPVPSVAGRFALWAAAAEGGSGRLRTTRLPGHCGNYVVFAAAAQA